jgi:hypothetical protein
MTTSYFEAVYAADTQELTDAFIKAIALCPVEEPVRNLIIACALVSAAQLVDGNAMPRQAAITRYGGVAENVRQILATTRVGHLK